MHSSLFIRYQPSLFNSNFAPPVSSALLTSLGSHSGDIPGNEKLAEPYEVPQHSTAMSANPDFKNQKN